MLKKVSVDELRLGMYLHGLCGSWVDHPFWKSKFELTSASDLARLRDGAVRECWIDVSKGLDVVAVPATPVVAVAPAVAAAPTPAPAPVAVVALREEIGRAAVPASQARLQMASLFRKARMGQALDAGACLPLVADITDSVWRNPGALISLARLKTHDDYSYMHSVAVCALMVSRSRQLGHDEAQARATGLAGLLHDMGKAMMPLDVLNKPGKLTAAEFDPIKSHPQRGHDLLKGAARHPRWRSTSACTITSGPTVPATRSA